MFFVPLSCFIALLRTFTPGLYIVMTVDNHLVSDPRELAGFLICDDDSCVVNMDLIMLNIYPSHTNLFIVFIVKECSSVFKSIGSIEVIT